jgi:hypothetical protein
MTYPTDLIQEDIDATAEYVLILIVTADAKVVGARSVEEVTGWLSARRGTAASERTVVHCSRTLLRTLTMSRSRGTGRWRMSSITPLLFIL